VDRSKAEVVLEAQRLGVDLAGTLSCYDPATNGRPCGRCDSCRLRARGFREAGIPDPSLSG
jgi:7-cyano-7-deazaguanine synthase